MSDPIYLEKPPTSDRAAYSKWRYHQKKSDPKFKEQRRKAYLRDYAKRRIDVIADTSERNRIKIANDPNFTRRIYERHKSKIRKQHHQYYLKNVDKFAEWRAERRLVARRAKPRWYERNLVAQLYEKCVELNERLGLQGADRLAVDHIIPLKSDTVCGLHCWANLQLLSMEENSRKNNRYQTDW